MCVCVCALLIQILVSSSIPGDIQISKTDVNLLRIERFSRREVHSIHSSYSSPRFAWGARAQVRVAVALFVAAVVVVAVWYALQLL